MPWLWDVAGGGDGDRIDCITDDLAVTNLEAASDLESLTRHGIRAIVDASNREGNPRFPGILYHQVPIADPDERFAEFLPGVMAFIDGARRHGAVLLHCVAGRTREMPGVRMNGIQLCCDEAGRVQSGRAGVPPEDRVEGLSRP
jgi:hypothetical protein